MKTLSAASLFNLTLVGSAAFTYTCLTLIDASIKSLFLLILATTICLIFSRHDPRICTIGLLVRALNWFNPLAWYAVERLRMECEQACDDHVLKMGVDASDYASHLLELSTSVRFASSVGPLAMAMASKTGIENRVAAILDDQQNRRGVTFFRAAGMIAMVSIGVAVMASVAIRASQDSTVIEKATENNVQKTDELAMKKVETNQPIEPLSLDDQSSEIIDLSLEQCIEYALKNTITAKFRNLQDQNTAADIREALNQLDAQSKAFKCIKSKRSVKIDIAQIIQTQFQHPLEREPGSLVNRTPFVLTRINRDISISQFEERICNLVRDVEFAYWDLYAAYVNAETARAALESEALAHKIAYAKLKSGTSANAEAQARVTYQQFKAELDAALIGDGSIDNDLGLVGREQNLRLLIGWAANDERLIRPSDKPAVSPTAFEWNTIRDETLRRNPDLSRQKRSIQQRELELVSAKNQSSPDVNLSLNYRWLGDGSSLIDRRSGNTPFPVGQPSAFDELFGNDQKGGIQMESNSSAFGSRRKMNDIQNKQLSLAREHKILEAKETSAVNQLSRLWQQVSSLHKQVSKQLQALSAAQTLVEVTKAKFDAGDSSFGIEATIDNLLRAQQCRSKAGQNYSRALAEYNKSLVEIHRLKGSLLEYNNIKIAEEM